MFSEQNSDSDFSHKALNAWVEETARLTQPDAVVWCDGSEQEAAGLIEMMVANGTLSRLNSERHPHCFLHRSDPRDVARVEDRTFICSEQEEDAGPTNNWMSPEKMHNLLRPLFRRCMAGRTMYVVPYLMGPPGSPMARVGVEITDSPYVVASMRIMTRMGQVALRELGPNGHFVKGLHSTGRLDPRERYVSHFPHEDLVMSFSSNYGGNALLGKKCFALRLASVLARREGWLAEHMLILGITEPSGRKTYLSAAFPSACGKTNLSMLVPPRADLDAGWKIETIGDDIAWLKFGPDGRLHAINPEAGFFGVAPGTNLFTNPNALLTSRANTIFTNVALLPDRSVWWEGLDGKPPAQAIDWRGDAWSPRSKTPAAHPNSRFTAPASQCPCISPEWENPQGVPISAILFGGRRATTAPLAMQAYDWTEATYHGATMSSEKTAAAAGTIGQLRFDPMAMLPFCGYHMADYWRHWLKIGERGGKKMPSVFHVNWFRKSADGAYLWPGFGYNMEVLKWIIGRVHGEHEAVDSPIGWLPRTEDLDFEAAGLNESQARELLRIDRGEWLNETVRRADFFQRFGERMPAELLEVNATIRRRLG